LPVREAGGTLAAAFLVRSAGYRVAKPSVSGVVLSAESIGTVFAPHASGIRTERIGIVERKIRSGYSALCP
jgi:hypothetical protein